MTLTATVAPASATSQTAPTGTVSFYEDDLPPGGKLLGTVTLTANADGTASAALPPVTNLDVSGSPHHLYAVYSGDAANPAQQASITQSVSRASLAVTPDPVTCAFGTCQVWLGHLSGRVVGVQNNDPISVHYVTNATNSSPAGTYKITAQVTDGGTGRLSNYDVALSDGLMHVTLAGLKIQYKSPSSAKRGSRLVLKAVLQNALTRTPVVWAQITSCHWFQGTRGLYHHRLQSEWTYTVRDTKAKPRRWSADRDPQICRRPQGQDVRLCSVSCSTKVKSHVASSPEIRRRAPRTRRKHRNISPD